MANKRYKVVINGVEKFFQVSDNNYSNFIAKYPSAVLAGEEVEVEYQNNEQAIENAEQDRRDEWFTFDIAEDIEDWFISKKEDIKKYGDVMQVAPGFGPTKFVTKKVGEFLSWWADDEPDEIALGIGNLSFEEQQDIESGYTADKFLYNNNYNESDDLETQIDTYTSRKDLNLDSRQQNYGYNPDGVTDFVMQNYDLESLDLGAIDLKDFEGYLKRKGFMDQYNENMEAGLYGNETYTNADGEEIKIDVVTVGGFGPNESDDVVVAHANSGYTDAEGNPISYGEMARQEDLRKWLDEYRFKTDQRGVEQQALKYIKENKEKFEGLSLNDAMQEAVEELKGLDKLYSSHDRTAFENYDANFLPALHAKKLQQEEELKDYYEEIKNRTANINKFSEGGELFDGMYIGTDATSIMADGYEDFVVTTVNTLLGIPVGFYESVEDLSWWLGSFAKDDEYSLSSRRALDTRRFSPKELMAYTYTGDGKSFELDGIEYVVNEDGIFDTTNNLKLIDGAISIEEKEKILSAAEKEGVMLNSGYGDFSARGFSNQLGPVLGDLITQIVGPKGVGYGIKGLKGISNLAKVNGFKNVAQFNRYLKLQKQGKFLGGRQFDAFSRNLGRVKLAGKSLPGYSLIKKIPVNRELASVITFQSLYGMSNGYKNVATAGIEAGLTNDQITALGSTAQLQMGALYALTGPIAPRLKAMKAIDDWFLGNNVFANSIKWARANTPNNLPKGFNIALKRGIQKYLGSNLAKTTLAFAKEGMKEVVQENIQQLGETKLVNVATNVQAGMDLMNTEYDLKDFYTTSLLSFAAGGLMGGGATFSSNRKVNNQNQFQNLYMLSQMDPALVDTQYQLMVDSNQISQEEMDNQVNAINEFRKGVKGLSSFYGSKSMWGDGLRMVELNAKVRNLKEQYKNANEANKPEIKTQLDEAIKAAQEFQAASRVKFNNLKETKKAKAAIDKQVEQIKAVSPEGTVKAFDSNEDLSAYLDEKFGTNTRERQEAEAGLRANGFFDVDGEIIISKENAIVSQTVSTASHELLHAIIKSKEGTPEFQTMIEEFKEILKGETMVNGENAFEFLQNKLRNNYQDLAAAQGISVEQYLQENASEWLTGLSDLIVDGEIKFDDAPKSFWKKLMDIVVNFFGFTKSDGTTQETLNTEFKTGKQAFEFIKNYNKVLSDPSEENVQVLKKAVAKGVKAQKKNQRGGRQFQTTAASTKKALGDLDKQFKAQGIASLKSAATQDIIARNIYGMASAIVENRYGGLSRAKKEELRDAIVSRLYIAGENTKFDGRGTLQGFLNGRLSLRLKDEVEENYDKIFKDSDYNQFDTLENNLNIIAETESEQKSDERKQTETLPNDGIVTSEINDSIDNKILKIVRVLKTRLNTIISLNIAKKFPLIVELKKEFGKALDIDLKKQMGGKKNNSYKNWLVKHRRSLLKNLPTSYLLTAYPEAVQKSVGGKFNADGTFTPNFVDYNVWRNAKIDREKTTTDNRGATSGNQIIRKHPNVENVISEEAFLANQIVLDENGNIKSLIRGRKESLAKATAETLGFQKLSQELDKPQSVLKQALIDNQERLGELEIASQLNLLQSQIENGTRNYQAGTSLNEKMEEGIVIAFSTAKNGVYSDAFYDWYSGLKPQEAIYWDQNFDNLVNPGVKAFKDNMQSILEDENVSPEFKQEFEKYLETNTSNSNDVSMQQLTDFTVRLMEDIDPSLFSGKGRQRFLSGIFGQHHRYLGTVKGTAGYSINQFIKNMAAEEGVIFTEDGFSIDMASVEFVKGNQGILLAISRIKAKGWKFDENGNPVETDVFSEMSRDAKIAKIESVLGKRISKINEANKQLQSYLMLKATEIVAKNPDLAPGMFRWLESQSNIQNHARGLTTVDGSYISAFPQNEYTNESTYEINKKHPLYKLALQEVDALTTLEEQIDKIIDAKSKLKVPETITRAQAKNIIIAKVLQDKGEHTFASANQMAVFAEEILYQATILRSNSTAAETNSTLATAKLKFDDLAGQFGQTSLPKVLSDILDSNIGATNQSRQLRYLALDPKILNEIHNFKTPLKSEIDSMIGAMIRGIDMQQFVSAQVMQKAINKGRNYQPSRKGISVYDFDDTLAFSKSKVIVTLDGKTTKITPAEFAVQAEELTLKGAKFDFSEFNRVVQGTPGPLVPRLRKAIDKFGNKNIFVLTARPQASAKSIYEFLKGLGVTVPLKNIVGLENGSPAAKAGWMINKVADGFNDFYFVDDAIKNVKAVSDVLNVFDVKGKVQQARQFQAANLDLEFNQMLERQSGVKAEARYSDVVARKIGKDKGKYRFFIPSSADDFRGLTSYTFAGKGKQGEMDQQWIEENLVDPYVSGISQYENYQLNIKRGYGDLIKVNGGRPFKKKLQSKIPGSPFTYEDAIRVHIWTKQGKQVPGLSQRDLKLLNDTVNNDTQLSAFADALVGVTFEGNWSDPKETWAVGNIMSDLNDIAKVGRSQFLTTFNQNVDIIFSKENLNKIEALYGTRHREAIEDIIRRMKSGSNRPSGGNRITNNWNTWVNNSIGTIMFFNRRSALLQTISTINFVNWSDNNPVAAAKAFANLSQWSKDFTYLWNSDKLKARRGGLKSDLQEQEIAEAAKKGPKNLVSYLLKIGFTPTQLADSFAIASGGASFYRNRINTYLKEGMDQKAAEEKAFKDFSKISDATQQSGDPMLISQQQSNWIGRLVLAFQNTPMQYTRLMKKAAQDIANGRGDLKTNVSKIIYYGFIQNVIFHAMSQALFALIPGFDDEDDDEESANKKTTNIIHGSIDTILRGSGIYGAVVSTVKNAIRRYHKEESKGWNADHTYTMIELLNVMPALGSKFRKQYNAFQTRKFDKDVIAEHPWAVVVDGKVNISPTYSIIGSTVSAWFNIPLDRLILETTAVAEMFDSRNSAWQRIALALGWRAWDVGAKSEEFEAIKGVRRSNSSSSGVQTRNENKKIIRDLEFNLSPAQFNKYKRETKGFSPKEKIAYLRKIK